MIAVKTSIIRFLKRVWPQAPFGLVMIFIGASNIFTRSLQPHGNSTVYQVLAHLVPISELSREVSLGILGSGVQVLLGAVIVITGIGLFWRLRSAWAFSIILLVITIAVEYFSHRTLPNLLLPGLALVALIVWQSRFDRLSSIGSFLMSFVGVLAVFAYGVFGAYLLGNEFNPPIHDLSTALYFTVVTLSTVGSYIYPASAEGQLFMVTLILGGISIFTTTIVSTARPIISKKFRSNGQTKKTDKKTDGIILAGDSSFADSVAEELTRRNILFARVKIPERRQEAEQLPVSNNDSVEESQLSLAEIHSAKIILIAYEDDATSISMATTAKRLNTNIKMAAAVHFPDTLEKLLPLQADLVFTLEAAGTKIVTDWILGNPFPKGLQELFRNGRL